MVRAYIGVGSNLGDRCENIHRALKMLNATKDITVSRISELYETEPVGGPPQGKYLNGAVELQTELTAQELLKTLKRIEIALGRVKTIRNGPRIIDLDILIYGDEIINERGLKVPHPRMNEREFVLKPLREIMTHPTLTCGE